MRYLLRHLQRVGLVSTLLIVGVLGGLMAPLPSEATGVSLTLQVDNLPASNPPSILILSGGDPSPGVCTAAEGTGTGGQGFTNCWNVKTDSTTYTGACPSGGCPSGTTGRKYTVQQAVAGTSGRLKIADKLGQDKMQLVGVKFVPVQPVSPEPAWSTTETHTLTIKEYFIFDGAVNVANATDISDFIPGRYSWTVRSAGEFIAPSGQNAVGDSVTFTGTGTFSASLVNVPILSPAANNICFTDGRLPACPSPVPSPNPDTRLNNSLPLSFTVLGPASDPGPLNYDGLTNPFMGQIVTYPRFICIHPTVTTTCQPEITLVMTASLIGFDTLKVINGDDAYCAQCVLTAQEIIVIEKEKQKLAKKLQQKIDLVNRPSPGHTPGLDALIALLTTFLDVKNFPDPDCLGEQFNEIAVINAAILDAEACLADNCKPAEPAPTHYYAVISKTGATWTEARAEAQLLGAGWDLATITSGAEQALINDLLGAPPSGGPFQYWVGGFQTGATEPGGNWKWINEEGTFWNQGSTGMFSNWGAGLPPLDEPNDCCVTPGVEDGEQNHLALDNRYPVGNPAWGWDDNDNFLGGTIRGYVAEGLTPLLPPPPLL